MKTSDQLRASYEDLHGMDGNGKFRGVNHRKAEDFLTLQDYIAIPKGIKLVMRRTNGEYSVHTAIDSDGNKINPRSIPAETTDQVIEYLTDRMRYLDRMKADRASTNMGSNMGFPESDEIDPNHRGLKPHESQINATAHQRFLRGIIL